MSYVAASMTVALLLVAQEQPAKPPLVVTRMSIDACDPHSPADGYPRIEVRNTGTRTILAWWVKYQLKYSDGRTQPGGEGVDAALVLPEHRTAAVAPDSTAAIPTPCGGQVVPTDTTIADGTVTYVILDDDTAIGDEHYIALAFDIRRPRQMFWQKMQAIVEQATAQTTDPAAALSRIREHMEAEPNPNFRIADYQWFMNAMSPRDMARTTPQALLDSFRSRITLKKANADAHAVRR